MFSQQVDMDAANARDEFRWGVLAFHRQLFNEAGLAFNRSLSFKPEDSLVRDWLGRTWYRAGFEDAALKTWSALLDSGGGSLLLRNRVNILEGLRGLDSDLHTGDEYITARKFESHEGTFRMFSRPTSVVPRRDGGFYLVSWASNEVFLFNANAARVMRIQAGFEGLHQPYDLLEMDGNLFISEFGADRITKCTTDGRVLVRFGESGRGAGGLLGPQYLTGDDQGYLYVTDIGNKRVSKFDSEGRFILSFAGTRSGNFPGLRRPTGILAMRERIFVADAWHKSVFVFDQSGNYLAVLQNCDLNGPEGITALDDETLLIADGTRLIAYRLDQSLAVEISDFQNEAVNVVKAAVDVNGNIVAADLDGDRIFVLSEMATMTAGYFVQIDSVNSAGFPEVIAEISVHDRVGNPVCGLDWNNFIITENFQATGPLNIIFEGNKAETMNVSVLIDSSLEMERHSQDVRKAIEDIVGFGGSLNSIRLVSSGETPVLESRPEDLKESLPLIGSSLSEFSANWRFDTGVRLASSQLLQWEDKRAVIFITRGELRDSAFVDYDLIELAQYMENNRISFHVVYLDRTVVSDELTYLCDVTGGSSRYLYEPRGLTLLEDEIFNLRSGSYYIRYTSPSLPEYGTEYIPIEVEVALFTKSGRDEMGYFAPEQ